MNFCSVIESWCFSYFILYFRLLHMGNHSYLVLLVFSWPESPITAVLFRFLSEILWLQDLLLQLKINKFNFLKKDHLYLPKKLTLKLIFVTHSIFSHKIYALSSKFHLASISPWASLVAQLVKNLPAMQETWVQSLQVQSPEEGKGYPLMFWPGEFHGLYSPWVHKESDTTEQLSFFCITENYLNYI